MKIKTIEKIINFKDLGKLIVDLIQKDYDILYQSSEDDNIFYLDAFDEKSRNLKIGIFNDFEFNRTFILLILIKTNKLSGKAPKFNNEEKMRSFIQLINSVNIIKSSRKIDIKFNQIESELIQKFSEEIMNRFGYKDKLMKYPFSVTSSVGLNKLWMSSYNKYLDLLEKNFLKKGIKSSEIFRYYDFANNSEIYQRIIDLIVITEIMINEKEDYFIDMLFFYINKSQKKFKILKFVKLYGEIKKYCKMLETRLKNKEKKIRPYLIIISSFGFDTLLLNYISNHLYNEFQHIIPIFAISLVNGKVLHNLNENSSLLEELEYAKEKTKLKLRKFRKINNPAPYRRDQIKSESKRFTEIEERISNIQNNSNLISFFSKIISIQELKNFINNEESMK